MRGIRSVDESSLSPYIADSLRRQRMEAAQRKALIETLAEVGIDEERARARQRSRGILGHASPFERPSAQRQWYETNEGRAHHAAHMQMSGIEVAEYQHNRHLDRGSVRRALGKGVDAELVSRAAIIERDGRTCYLCGAAELRDEQIHLDHVVPISKGGNHTADNLRVSCGRCNMSKGSHYLADYLATLPLSDG